MTKIMKGGVAYNTTSNMVALTQAEYNALSTAQKNNGNFYFITDADPSYFSAENIDYDNTDSGLTATNVQDAIDEVYQSKTASYGGTDLSLVTTGEKYNWDNKAQGYLIRNMQIKSGSPGVISNTGGYSTMMVLGFAQSIGAVAVLIKINNNSITNTIDMFTGSAFSSAVLTFSYSSSAQQFTISSTNANTSALTVIKAGL